MGGHGWVHPREDGSHARCGGPAMCLECADEARVAGFTRWHGYPLPGAGPVETVAGLRARLAERDALLERAAELLTSCERLTYGPHPMLNLRRVIEEWLRDNGIPDEPAEDQPLCGDRWSWALPGEAERPPPCGLPAGHDGQHQAYANLATWWWDTQGWSRRAL